MPVYDSAALQSFECCCHELQQAYVAAGANVKSCQSFILCSPVVVLVALAAAVAAVLL